MKKNLFDSKKEDFLTGAKGKIEIKPISEEQRLLIRSKIKEENKSGLKIAYFAILILLILITWFTIMMINHIKASELQQKAIKETQAKQEKAKKTEDYLFYINDGDNWMNKRNYYNAKFQYYNALNTNINNEEALKRLIIAYTEECITHGENCNAAINDISRLIQRFPEFSPLYVLAISLKENQGDTSELKKYRSVLNILQLTEK